MVAGISFGYDMQCRKLYMCKGTNVQNDLKVVFNDNCKQLSQKLSEQYIRID